MVNSLKISIITTVIGIFFTATAAYAFSLRFRGRRSLLQTILLIQAPQLFSQRFCDALHAAELSRLSSTPTRRADPDLYLGGILGVNTWLMAGLSTRFHVISTKRPPSTERPRGRRSGW
ncbi:MAG: hypothetical protein R2873_16875 [Caldilineaceae bacterium]